MACVFECFVHIECVFVVLVGIFFEEFECDFFDFVQCVIWVFEFDCGDWIVDVHK